MHRSPRQSHLSFQKTSVSNGNAYTELCGRGYELAWETCEWPTFFCLQKSHDSLFWDGLPSPSCSQVPSSNVSIIITCEGGNAKYVARMYKSKFNSSVGHEELPSSRNPEVAFTSGWWWPTRSRCYRSKATAETTLTRESGLSEVPQASLSRRTTDPVAEA